MQQNNNTKWRPVALLAIGACIGMAALHLMGGASGAGVVTAKRLQIVNSAGRPVVVLSADSEQGRIDVCNRDGKVVAWLSVAKDGLSAAMAIGPKVSLLSSPDGGMITINGSGAYTGIAVESQDKSSRITVDADTGRVWETPSH